MLLEAIGVGMTLYYMAKVFFLISNILLFDLVEESAKSLFFRTINNVNRAFFCSTNSKSFKADKISIAKKPTKPGTSSKQSATWSTAILDGLKRNAT